MTTVLHLVETWLDVSAGFVAAHVEHSRHRGVVVSRKPFASLDAFPHRPRLSLARVHDLAPRAVRTRVTAAALDLAAARYGADVVHTHFGYPLPFALRTTRRRRTPLVLSLHGEDATALPQRSPHHYDGAAAVTAVIVPSRFLARRAHALGFRDEQVHVIPAGVDTEFFQPGPPATAPVVAHVGRLVAKKGLDVLLAAWPAVVEAVPGARLRVLGDGPLRALLSAAPPSVEHVLPDPRRRREQVREVLHGARVVAAPSRTAADGDAESLLLVNLEAMACGRPVVSTRHGGIPEYVDDGVTGLLVPEADGPALASALVATLTDDALCARLAAAGLSAVQRLDVRRCSARVDDLYDALLAK